MLRRFDADGRLIEAAPKASLGRSGTWITGTNIKYDSGGEIAKFSATDGSDSPSPIVIAKRDGSAWSIDIDGSYYKWNGDIRVAPADSSAGVEKMELVPEGGKPVDVRIDDTTMMQKVIMDKAQLVYDRWAPNSLLRLSLARSGDPSAGPLLQVDDGGNVTVTRQGYSSVHFNGKVIEPGQSVVVTPEDNVTLFQDFGDKGPDWHIGKLNLVKNAQGQVTMDGQPLEPGIAFNLDFARRR